MGKQGKKNILINCSNLHIGGGVAVASSFIDCLSRMNSPDLEFSVLVSDKVDENLRALGVDVTSFSRYQVKCFKGLSALWKGLDLYFKGADLVFTVFGPSYFLIPRTKHVFGFAQAHIIYPDPVAEEIGWFTSFKSRLKYKLQEIFFSRADSLIVELDHVKKGLQKKALFKNKNIAIVPNCVHDVFRREEGSAPMRIPETNSLKLGIVSRNYPHKNLKILPQIKDVLLEKYNLKVKFFVTFNDEEWEHCDSRFKESIFNVGPLNLAQCPAFYSEMDGIIFPSLLECSSAVPYEAMLSKRPLFASDLAFIRESCGEHCRYFDPKSPESAAEAVSAYYSLDSEAQREIVENAYSFADRKSDASDRARNYLAIISEVLKV